MRIKKIVEVEGYDAESNTLYLNYAGMRVRSEADIKAILAAVTGRSSRSVAA